MLWACLHIPDFSLQLLQRAAAPVEPVIVSSGGNRPMVLSCDAQARSHGIAPGMKVSAAVALAPDLVERHRDAAGERHALERIAGWAGQFSSMVSLSPPDALLLEVEGSLRLFGGLRQIMLRLSGGLNELGYTGAAAVTPTPTAARLLALAGLQSTVTDLAGLESALSGLPLALLDQPAETVRMLALAGVHTVGACFALPRDGLARRFGQSLVDELDRALAKLPDPRRPYEPPARYRARLALPAPVHETEPLLFAAKRLILELAGFLRAKQAGVTRLKLTLCHEDRRPTVVRLSFSAPSRDPQRILHLLRERLARLELPQRVEAILLESEEARSLDSRNLSLFPEDNVPEEERSAVLDHLRARLGVDAVYSIASHADHRPELAWRACQIGVRGEPGAAEPGVVEYRAGGRPERPLWLLDQPRRLQLEDEAPALDGPLTLLAGPERIESGWWDGNDVARDYFIAANGQGRRFWIFRERGTASTWFLQGIFA